MKRIQQLAFYLASIVVIGSLPVDAIAGGEDEIQVYTDQINGAGNFGWEMHQNWFPVATKDSEYSGDSPAQGQFRHTSEFSYGITDNWELGAYLPLMLKNGTVNLEGGRGRIKFLDHYNEETFYGFNVEYGYISYRSEDHHWNTEIRPIIGYRNDDWLLSFNPVIGWATSGAGTWRPTFDPQMKVGHSVGNGIMLGVEHYSGFGEFSNFDPWQQQSQTTYLALDTIKFNTNFNIGIGHGWNGASNDLTVKFIIGLPVSGWKEKLIGL